MYQLREMRREDMPYINAWRNDKALADCLGGPFRYVNPDTDAAWYERYQQNRASQVRCAIVEEAMPHLPLGLVSLTGIDPILRSAEFHIMIGPEHQGRGLGPFALHGILRHAFMNLNLHRVELTVLPGNERALSMYLKEGFRQEGVRRQAAFKNGAYQDLIVMGILAGEFVP